MTGIGYLNFRDIRQLQALKIQEEVSRDEEEIQWSYLSSMFHCDSLDKFIQYINQQIHSIRCNKIQII
jgi:hypothetical protein